MEAGSTSGVNGAPPPPDHERDTLPLLEQDILQRLVDYPSATNAPTHVFSFLYQQGNWSRGRMERIIEFLTAINQL